MPFLFLNAEVPFLRLLEPLLPESEDELLRLARRFIQLENGRRFECLSVNVFELVGGDAKSTGREPTVRIDGRLVTYHVGALVLPLSPC